MTFVPDTSSYEDGTDITLGKGKGKNLKFKFKLRDRDRDREREREKSYGYTEITRKKSVTLETNESYYQSQTGKKLNILR